MGKSHKRDREDEDPEEREKRREMKKAEKVCPSEHFLGCFVLHPLIDFLVLLF